MRSLTLPIASLVHPAQNANKMSDEQVDALKAFMARIGFGQPILVRHLGNDRWKVLDGNHRVKAWRSLGNLEIPAIECESSEDEQYIALGYNNNRGATDYAVAALALKDLSQTGYSLDDLALTGMSKQDIEALLKATSVVDQTNDLEKLGNGTVPEMPKNDDGKIWKIELEYADKGTYLKCKRLLGRADPQGRKDVSRGLLKVLDLL